MIEFSRNKQRLTTGARVLTSPESVLSAGTIKDKVEAIEQDFELNTSGIPWMHILGVVVGLSSIVSSVALYSISWSFAFTMGIGGILLTMITLTCIGGRLVIATARWALMITALENQVRSTILVNLLKSSGLGEQEAIDFLTELQNATQESIGVVLKVAGETKEVDDAAE